MHGETVKF